MYIEVSPTLRLRPSHVLLMIHRYLSGIYQTGDLFALNYIKGFLDGNATPPPTRVLTISGHGIGEAETWLADRLYNCHIDSLSFRLIDTQLLHFLRATEPNHIEMVFSKFAEMVAPYNLLSELVASPGLVPYWCNQARQIQHYFQNGKVTVFSNHPLQTNYENSYDLIYVSQGTQYLSIDSPEKLRGRLSPDGWLAILTPSSSSFFNCDGAGRFATSTVVLEAKALFRSLLESAGYVLTPLPNINLRLTRLSSRTEISRFSVLATAKYVLVGELILASLGEHISDRARLQALNDTAVRFTDLKMSVSEELELSFIKAAA